MDGTRHKALFQELLDTQHTALRRLCHGYERDEASRHDLEQEIWLNLWRALPRYRGDASLRTWMYRVAHNVASRHVARAIRTPKPSFDERRSERQVASTPSPDEVVAQADARARLRLCINQLRSLDRQIILLFLEDIPQAEIGEITGLSQANVSTRVHRIKGELTKMMSE
jgi:RNA polymerase sigma factor (sigma-70 family)